MNTRSQNGPFGVSAIMSPVVADAPEGALAKPSKPSKTRRTHIAVQAATKQRLDALAADMMAAYVAGRTTRVTPVEQGGRGEWITTSQVIDILLDDYLAHARRSRRKGSNAAKGVNTPSPEGTDVTGHVPGIAAE